MNLESDGQVICQRERTGLRPGWARLRRQRSVFLSAPALATRFFGKFSGRKSGEFLRTAGSGWVC